MTSFHVVLYGRPGCCLCDRAAELLHALHGEFPHTLEKRDINDDASLPSNWCCQIPILFIDGGNRLALRINEERLRRAFSRALQNRQTSEV